MEKQESASSVGKAHERFMVNVWFQMAGLVIAVASVGVAVVLQLSSRNEKEITAVYREHARVDLPEEFRPLVDSLYSGLGVEGFHVVTVRIQNTGDIGISGAEDIDDSLRMQFDHRLI